MMSGKSLLDFDVENTSDYLYNATVNTLYWDKVSVKLKNKQPLHSKYILDSIDGAASAGQSSSTATPSSSPIQ